MKNNNKDGAFQLVEESAGSSNNKSDKALRDSLKTLDLIR